MASSMSVRRNRCTFSLWPLLWRWNAICLGFSFGLYSLKLVHIP